MIFKSEIKKVIVLLLSIIFFAGCEIEDANYFKDSFNRLFSPYSIIGRISKGTVMSGTVTIFDENGTLLGSGEIENGEYDIAIDEEYTGKVLVRAEANKYIDEATGIETLSSLTMTSVANVDENNFIVNVTPITNIASMRLGVDNISLNTLDANMIEETNTHVAQTLGCDDTFFGTSNQDDESKIVHPTRSPFTVINENNVRVDDDMSSRIGVVMAAISQKSNVFLPDDMYNNDQKVTDQMTILADLIGSGDWNAIQDYMTEALNELNISVGAADNRNFIPEIDGNVSSGFSGSISDKNDLAREITAETTENISISGVTGTVYLTAVNAEVSVNNSAYNSSQILSDSGTNNIKVRYQSANTYDTTMTVTLTAKEHQLTFDVTTETLNVDEFLSGFGNLFSFTNQGNGNARALSNNLSDDQQRFVDQLSNVGIQTDSINENNIDKIFDLINDLVNKNLFNNINQFQSIIDIYKDYPRLDLNGYKNGLRLLDIGSESMAISLNSIINLKNSRGHMDEITYDKLLEYSRIVNELHSMIDTRNYSSATPNLADLHEIGISEDLNSSNIAMFKFKLVTSLSDDTNEMPTVQYSDYIVENLSEFEGITLDLVSAGDSNIDNDNITNMDNVQLEINIESVPPGEAYDLYKVGVPASLYNGVKTSDTNRVTRSVTLSEGSNNFYAKVDYVDEDSALKLNVILDTTAPIMTDANISINENLPLGEEIDTITGTDDGLTYTINSTSDRNLFLLNETSGVLSVNEVFDYEVEPNEYNISITTKDIAGNETNSSVIIHILNVVDEKPVLVSAYNVDMNATQTSGTHVVNIEVNGTTIDSNVTDSFEISDFLPTAGSSFFEIDNNGTITLSRDLNDSSESQYTMEVIAKNSFGYSESALVTVNIFREGTIVIDLIESSDTGISNTDNITKIKSPTFNLDLSTISNSANVKIFINNVERKDFIKNSDSYELNLEDELISLNDDDYNITANINDSLSSNILVITIDSEISNIENQTINIDENNDSITSQQKVLFDSIEVNDDNLSFAFNANDYSASFSIDEETGDVKYKPNTAFNFELNSSYILDVNASDIAGNSVGYMLTIEVNNLAEEAPVLVATHEENISESTTSSDIIWVVEKNGATADQNITTGFRIISQTPQNNFGISDEGRVYLLSDANTSEDRYTLNINALNDYDTSSPDTILTINIIRETISLPDFTIRDIENHDMPDTITVPGDYNFTFLVPVEELNDENNLSTVELVVSCPRFKANDASSGCLYENPDTLDNSNDNSDWEFSHKTRKSQTYLYHYIYIGSDPFPPGNLSSISIKLKFKVDQFSRKSGANIFFYLEDMIDEDVEIGNDTTFVNYDVDAR